MNALPSILALFLVACQTDPNAGMVAARITGQQECVWFSNRDRLESAALFPFEGQWWAYHPELGSRPTSVPSCFPAPFDIFDPSLRCKVLPKPKDADLLNGCLPRAIASQRIHGGAIVQTAPGHVVNRY